MKEKNTERPHPEHLPCLPRNYFMHEEHFWSFQTLVRPLTLIVLYLSTYASP